MSELEPKRPVPYEAPELLEYGLLRDLTAGGSGNAQEPSQGQRPRA